MRKEKGKGREEKLNAKECKREERKVLRGINGKRMRKEKGKGREVL
jgi:hypothetical protein